MNHSEDSTDKERELPSLPRPRLAWVIAGAALVIGGLGLAMTVVMTALGVVMIVLGGVLTVAAFLTDGDQDVETADGNRETLAAKTARTMKSMDQKLEDYTNELP